MLHSSIARSLLAAARRAPRQRARRRRWRQVAQRFDPCVVAMASQTQVRRALALGRDATRMQRVEPLGEAALHHLGRGDHRRARQGPRHAAEDRRARHAARRRRRPAARARPDSLRLARPPSARVGRFLDGRSPLEVVSTRRCMFRNARARNAHVEVASPLRYAKYDADADPDREARSPEMKPVAPTSLMDGRGAAPRRPVLPSRARRPARARAARSLGRVESRAGRRSDEPSRSRDRESPSLGPVRAR